MEYSLNDYLVFAPIWVQYWALYCTVVLLAGPVVLFFSKKTWRDGVIMLVSFGLMMLIGGEIFRTLGGYTRLLGLSHIVTWTPLAIYLFIRLKDQNIPKFARITMIVCTATLVASLVLDYIDTARYVLGEREILYLDQLEKANVTLHN